MAYNFNDNEDFVNQAQSSPMLNPQQGAELGGAAAGGSALAGPAIGVAAALIMQLLQQKEARRQQQIATVNQVNQMSAGAVGNSANQFAQNTQQGYKNLMDVAREAYK